MTSNQRLCVAVLLAAFAVQAWIAAKRDSVTIDEFVIVPQGLAMLRSGDLSIDPKNPPLGNILLALPTLIAGPSFEFRREMLDRESWVLGYLLMEGNAGRYHALYLLPRLLVIVVGVLLGVLVFHWARALYGTGAAFAALLLYTLCPNLLAYSHLATLDLPGAAAYVLTAYACWRYIEDATLRNACLLGSCAALAALLKLSGLIAVPTVLGLILARVLREWPLGKAEIQRRAGHLAAAGLIGLFLLNLCYLFQGTLTPLAKLGFAPRGILGRSAALLPWLPSPLPATLMRGIDLIMTEGKVGLRQFFLLGELSSEGWWYYHLVAFLIKTPVPVLALTLVALGLWLMRRYTVRGDSALFVPFLVVFVANSLFNSLYIGVRHVLAAYPLLCVMAGNMLWLPVQAWFMAKDRRQPRQIAGAALAGIALAWLLASNLSIAPRYLQYANVLVGGAQHAHKAIIDSNIDWGQDLIRLQEFLDQRGSTGTVNMAYFGRVLPEVYGIEARPVTRDATGLTIVSATFLMGRPYFEWRNGRCEWSEEERYSWLQHHEPIARVGALFVYELPAADAARHEQRE